MSRIKKNVIWGLVISMMWLGNVNGQTNYLPDIVPPSPEVATLGKFIDVPVTPSTGIPNISIPLFSLSEVKLNTTVSLAYHASGIKVNEIASRTGLGWSLMGGGMISRQVRGIADDDPNGFINTTNTIAHYYQQNSGRQTSLIQEAVLGVADYESDVYHFNVGGILGKFYFKQDGTIVDHQKNDFKITAIKEGAEISGWHITDAKGNTYVFGITPNSTQRVHELKKTNYFIYPNALPLKSTYHITGWYLTRITDPYGNHIDFNYNTHNTNIEYWNLTGQNKIIHQSGHCSDSNSPTTSFAQDTYKPVFLTSIASSKGKIQFEYSHNRIDLKNDKALTAVKLLDTNNTLIDHYVFEYDYFTSPNGLEVLSYITDVDQRTKRLYLKSITHKKGTDTSQTYRFTYNQNHILPERFSFSQDFWGYYNGKDNDKLYPSIVYRPYISPIQVNGGNRTVSLAHAKALVLEEIEYPNKGKTRFVFESNAQDGYNDDFFVGNELETQIISGSRLANNPSQIGASTTQNFTISEFTKANFHIKAEVPCNYSAYDCPTIQLFKDNSIINTFNTQNYSGIIDLSVGQYTIKITNSLFDVENNVSIYFTQDAIINNNFNENPIAVVGGLRIREVLFLDYDNTILNKKKYEYMSLIDPSRSSGRSLNPPVFLSKNVPLFLADGKNCFYDQLSSNPIFPLNGQSGHHVTYTNVIEYNEGAENGKIEYTFTYAPDPQMNPSNVFESFGAVLLPSEDYSHRRGNLRNQKMFRYNSENKTFSLIEETNFIFRPRDPITIENLLMSGFGSLYQADRYYNRSERYLLAEKSITHYNNTGNITTTSHYNYDTGYYSQNFPKNISTTSNGKTITKKLYYPDDVTSTTALPGGVLSDAEFQAIKQLQTPTESNPNAQHRIGEVVQEVTEVTDTKGSATVSKRNNYANWGNNQILPKSVQTLKGAASSTGLEERAVFHRYDSAANPLEVSQKDGMRTVYLYGYSKQYPIAQIQNTTFSEIATALGVSEDALEDFNENHIGQINGLRAQKPEWMITTYTHIPLVGVKTITDPKGYTTTYEYDDFNRLKHIKDHNGDILEAYDYHYKNE